ncbi:hypothetical protein Ccrd_013727 [Cynara cardunculus var. scolymus]|uniref:Uncharacterized protein n=1 Tax=Cynara cardunculus var. scolymus TaxID=59895 RepID=A0A103YF23_CYNCS|nr:hypothetical protein Ccrd_013727 [Cynara cardunculus var. scolymus]
MGSNRKIGQLRPPAVPARTPMKGNDITENVCSMVPTSSGRCLAPSALHAHCGSTPLIPLPNYLRSTTKGVADSDIYPNLERKITQREDIKMQYDCRGSEAQVHKAIEQEKRTIGHDGIMKMEKFAWNNKEIKATHLTEQLGKGIGANIHLVGNEGNNKIDVENLVMSQGNDERVPLVPETKGGFVLHNEEDRLQNYTAISMSTSGQSIQHQEQNILTAIDGNTSFMQDFAQTSSEQADTEKSDAPKVNPEYHLDVDSLKAEDQVCKVFAESQKDGSGKSEDDVGATKQVSPGLQNCSVVLQHINIGQENDVAKVVDDIYKSSHTEDNAGCSVDSPCNETKGRISIPSRESLKDEAGNGGNTDARELEGTVTMLDTSTIPFQSMDTAQGNDDADNVPVFRTRPSITDAGTLVVHDHSSPEGFYINPSTSIENEVQLLDSPVRDAVMLVQHDNPSAESFHINTSTFFMNNAQLQDSPVRDVVPMVLPDNQYSEGFHVESNTFITSKVQLQDSWTANQSAKCFETAAPCVSALLNSQFYSEGGSVNCIMPTESSSLDDGPCDNVTEINDHFFQGRSNSSKAILIEVLDQKQDGVEVALIPGKPFAEARFGFRKVAPLIDDHNHSSLSCLRPEVELISATASVDDDTFFKTESVLQVAQCANTCPQSLEKEGLDLAAAAASEAELKIHEKNQKSQEMGTIIRSLSKKSIVAEESQHSCGNMMEANATLQGCTSGKVVPSIDDHNHYSLSCLRPQVELISGTAFVDDDAFFKTESVLQVAHCASTYPQSLEKEGPSLAAATEAEFKTNEENQKSHEMGMVIRSLSRKSIVAEESQHSCSDMEANATGCTDGLGTCNEFQSENKILECSETFNNFPKTHLEDAQMQLLDGDILVQPCSSLTSVLHNHSIKNVDHSDISEEQSEFSDNSMKLGKDLISNHQLFPTTDTVLQECVCKGVVNVVNQNDVYECDRKPSNTTVHSPPAGQAVGLHRNNNGQLCLEYGTSGSTAIDSIAEHNENYSDRQLTYNTKCSDLALLSELKSSDNDEIECVDTCMEYCSAWEESSSFLRKVADSMLEEKPTLFGEFGQVAADNKKVCIKSLSPEKNANLDKPHNALGIVISVPEQNIGHGRDRDLQNSNASALLPTVQGNVSDLNGEDQPNEPQGFDGIMPFQETYHYVTNEWSGYGLESSGQDPSESNSNFPVSQHPTTDGKFTSTAFCSATVESCSAAGGDKSLRTSTCRIGAEESKISFEEEVETEALQEGKHPIVCEFHHELDGGSDLKHNKDATVLTKRSNNIKKQDNSLVIHPPNAVPFSDEWLAAIEAAGEEILTMKHGAVQHSPPDKSVPEPSPWSPVKKKGNQIGPYDCTKYTNAMPSNPD